MKEKKRGTEKNMYWMTSVIKDVRRYAAFDVPGFDVVKVWRLVVQWIVIRCCKSRRWVVRRSVVRCSLIWCSIVQPVLINKIKISCTINTWLEELLTVTTLPIILFFFDEQTSLRVQLHSVQTNTVEIFWHKMAKPGLYLLVLLLCSLTYLSSGQSGNFFITQVPPISFLQLQNSWSLFSRSLHYITDVQLCTAQRPVLKSISHLWGCFK
jgi:hypothetical protein